MLQTDWGLLTEEAMAWVARRARLVAQPVYVDLADKFIVRSALQKSVRRGQTDRAVDLALKLHRMDSRYAWRAALTVAVEDVGAGSPMSVLWATAAQASTFRRAVGELPLLIALVREMAQALKSRAACELAFLVDTTRRETFKRLGAVTTSELLALVEGMDPYETYAALAVLRGTVPRGCRVRSPSPNALSCAVDIIEAQLPADHARAASAALLRPLDEMSVAIFPAFRLVQDCGDVEVVADDPPESRPIDGFASEAYDQHERRGRQAIRHLAADLQVREGLGATYAAVADAVFIEEGQCLNQWLRGPPLSDLREEADDCALGRHGLRNDQAQALREVVRAAIPQLNDLRNAVVSGPERSAERRAQAGP